MALISVIPGEGKAGGIVLKEAEKAIVIGEGMKRIKLVSKEIGAKYYQAWSKNFPKNGLSMTDAELAIAQARNSIWLKSKIKQGYKIYDIGLEKGRKLRSEFYKLEKEIIEKMNINPIKLEK